MTATIIQRLIRSGFFVSCLSLSATAVAAAPATGPAPKWPAPYRYPIGPGIQGLAKDSPEIVVADVLETNPERAIEGARDNARLKVVRTLLGYTHAGDTIGVYYHLHWIDDQARILEPAKLEQRKRYVLFLTSPKSTNTYEFTDQRMSAMPVQPRLEDEVAGAIRVAHGDTRGEFSHDVAAFQGRLVAHREETKNGTPAILLSLDLFNVTGRGSPPDVFDLQRATFTWEVTDEAGKVVASGATPGKWPKTLREQRVYVEPRQSARIPLSQESDEIPANRAGYLSLVPGVAWSFEQRDHSIYYLSGKIQIPVIGNNGWSGTLDLPKLILPTD